MFDDELDLSFFDDESGKDDKAVSYSHRLGKAPVGRRASSEKVLEEMLPWHFEQGDQIHVMSQGDVDSFSYVKHLMRAERFETMTLSTWCLAGEDLDDMEEWLESGKLRHIWLVVGEIFRSSYPEVYAEAHRINDRLPLDVKVFRNHAKVCILNGERSAVIESSANVNTNPRAEQTCITFDDGLARFYQDFYDGIQTFDKSFIVH